eukprot:3551758-Rhodomonas_salina.1
MITSKFSGSRTVENIGPLPLGRARKTQFQVVRRCQSRLKRNGQVPRETVGDDAIKNQEVYQQTRTAERGRSLGWFVVWQLCQALAKERKAQNEWNTCRKNVCKTKDSVLSWTTRAWRGTQKVIENQTAG